MKLSIIVPVYNVEKYISKCITSIIQQTFNDFELILVDDGSTDNSLSICKQFAAKDRRIQIYTIENGGASHARNFGLKKAQGQYIGFVDSDDFIHKDMYEHLVTLLECYDADMAVIGFEKIYEDGSVIQEKNGIEELRVMNKEEAMKRYLSDNYTFSHSLWTKLFKRETICSIDSPEGFTCEDDYVSLISILNCNKIVYDYSAYMYVYRMRAGSVSAKKYNIHNLDMFYMQSACFDKLKQYPEIQSMNARRIIRSYISFTGIVYGRGLKNNKVFIARLRDMRKKTSLYYKSAKLSKKEIIAYYAAKWTPGLFGAVYARYHEDIKSVTNAPLKSEKKNIVRYEQY